MDTLDDFYTTSTDDRLDAQRDIIRELLNEIANDIRPSFPRPLR